ncbi:hypothetical protein NPIL_246991, partial [Nephila pilipes]
IILLVVSLCTRKSCTQTSDITKSGNKKAVANGCLPKEENIENGRIQTISN